VPLAGASTSKSINACMASTGDGEADEAASYCTYYDHISFPVTTLARDGRNEGFDLLFNVTGAGADVACVQVKDVGQAVRPLITLPTHP